MDPLNASGAQFHTTQWNLVLVAGESDRRQADAALADLCRSYWPPLYAFARRQGLSPHDAQDAVQAFFLHLLERRIFERADPLRGRFRSFLLGAFKYFLAHERERAGAVKRGGQQVFVSIDAGEAEMRALAGVASADSSEGAFEQRWALTVLERALEAVAADAKVRGKEEVFAQLKPFLTSDQGGYDAVADALGCKPNALKTAVHRLRQEFRAALRREVARTLTDLREVDEELQHLRLVLGSTGLV